VTECPTCGAPVAVTDRFCESCGATLATGADTSETPAVEPATDTLTSPVEAPEVLEPRHCSCGGEIDADGWCTVCGLRAVSESSRYTEQPAPNVAAACDRGMVHARNEDATALAASHDRIVLVVCDGVSSTTDSEVASVAAARSARDVLDQAPSPPSRTPATLIKFWIAELEGAAATAQQQAEAAAAKVGARESPPSCTFVAAVVDGPVLVVGWVGDSRCYWFGDDHTDLQVSVDDSWAGAEMAQGTARDVAERDPRAHAITRWLGVDAPSPVPTCASVPVGAGGWVLVCSDGLWNYCSAAPDLRRLLDEEIGRVGGDPLAVASALCDWANEQGGHDNVTVALAHLTPTPPTATPAPPTATPTPATGHAA
jgi:serine/threonine protein phosphatase PrpC